MRPHRFSVLHIVALIADTLGIAAPLDAQETPAEAEVTPAEAEQIPSEAEEIPTESKKTSVELRFTIMSPSARWSKVESGSEMLAQHAERRQLNLPRFKTEGMPEIQPGRVDWRNVQADQGQLQPGKVGTGARPYPRPQ